MDKKHTNYILATHLHDLPNLPEIQSVSDRIQIKHLAVKKDPLRNTIEYTRILQDGPGDGNYGIIVAAALGLAPEILLIAEAVRKRYTEGCPETLMSTKRTHFNAKKFMKEYCEICKKNKTEHVHHIKEQNTANENGIIDGEFHKNMEHNLVSLCHYCHDDIHDRKTLIIYGYVHTTEGTLLKWERVEPKNADGSVRQPPLKKTKKFGDPFTKY
jgi:DNA mismatch repair protein MutS